MWSKEKITLVKDRLEFIKELTEISDHFKGINKIRYRNEKITHSYLHFSALRIYLTLTCFDILGQSDDWKDFNSWLRSKSKEIERQGIIEKFKGKDPIDLITLVHDEYLNIYGVKRAFYRFMQKIISDQDRDKLFGSIKGQKRLTEEIINPNGTITVPTGRDIELSISQKEKFLFDIRNSFTHNGITIGDSSAGIFKTEEPVFLPGEEEPRWFFIDIHRTKIGQDSISFTVQRWPFVIFEIIENTIK